MYSSRTKRLLSLIKDSGKVGDTKENGYSKESTSNSFTQPGCSLNEKAVIVEMIPQNVDMQFHASDNIAMHQSKNPIESALGSLGAKAVFENQDSGSSEDVSEDQDLNYSPGENDREEEQLILTDTAGKNKSRKRVRHIQNWKQVKRQEQKRKGEEYKTKKGKVKRAKVLQSACHCRRKCYDKIDNIQRQNIISELYHLSRHAQDQVLAESIEEKAKDRQRLAPGKMESRRSFSRK